MRWLFTFFLFLSFGVWSQSDSILVIGNHQGISFDQFHANVTDTLPKSLKNYGAVFIFSTANSRLESSDVDTLLRFMEEGKGLYLGSDNWPLQAESNQLTRAIFCKESYGNNDIELAECSSGYGNLQLDELDKIPAGKTTTSFPLDPRLIVEAWVNDDALILSGKISKGRVIIDGGYSRFYSINESELSEEILMKMYSFLLFK